MSRRVYADYNASAPLRPEARAAMIAAMDRAGNPSSAHREGARARAAIEEARQAVAALVGRPPEHVIFTSGATEANVLALEGLLEPGDRLVVSTIEHASILATASALEARGVQVRRVTVTPAGEIDDEALRAALDGGAAVAAFGLANGEVGTVLQPPHLALLRERARIVHLDVAQALGRLPLPEVPDGTLALSAHKLGGPTGVGALVAPPGMPLRPLLRGGPQERARRAGTENILGIVGFGAAARAVQTHAATEIQRIRSLRDDLWRRLAAAVPSVVRNGPPLERALPNTLNVTVPGISGEAVLVRLDLAGIAASLGSACAAGSPEPSHVLRAMGRSDDEARAGLRISLGWASEPEDVAAIVAALAEAARAGAQGAAA